MSDSVDRLLEPDWHDPACPFLKHCYCDDGAPHDAVRHPLAREAADAPVVRPEFRAGDALLFDHLFLHSTAVTDAMVRERYAMETWFFAPSAYPEGQIPLVL